MSDSIILFMAKEECCKCGIAFMVPQNYCNSRKETGRTFWCPNGHAMTYADNDASIEARRHKIKELHDSEQAEALAADTGANGNRAHAAITDPLADPTGDITVEVRSGRIQCPYCVKTFSGIGVPLLGHLSRKHNIDARGRKIIPIHSEKETRD